MVSFNLVFHLASALACVLLIYALLKLQGLVRFHKQLWQSLDPGRKAVQLEWPSLFVQRFGRAMDVPVEGECEKGSPTKIHMGVWVAAHLQLRFLRMTWQDGPELFIDVRDVIRDETWTQRLEETLGGRIKIRLRNSDNIQPLQGV